MVKHIYILVNLLILGVGTRESFAQIVLKNGASFFINSGTTLSFSNSTDSLLLMDSSRIINNGVISFNNSSFLNEQPGFPITGNGYEKCTILNPVGTFEPANLGLTITLSLPSPEIVILRYHSDTLSQLSGANSIKRNFTITSTGDPGLLNLAFEYDSTELNSMNEEYLKLIRINSSSILNLGGFENPSNNIVSGESDSLFLYTLSETSTALNPLADSVLCAGETLDINFNAIGIYNNSNEFILWLTNGTDTSALDTVTLLSQLSGLLPDSLSGSVYNVFITSSNIPEQSINSINITVNGLPQIDTSQVISEYCTNAGQQTLILLPAGGILSGNGVSSDLFDPVIAGAGTSLLNYSYTDSNSCTGTEYFSIIVFETPVVNFSSIPSVCENDPSFNLNLASPPGGIYSGLGITTSPLFDPSLSGAGSHLITYTVTDTNNCTGTDTSQINVQAIPSIPVITQNVNVLSTSTNFSYLWYLNGSPISGGTTQNYTAAVFGTYQVEVFSANGCSILSEPYNYQNNFINQIELKENSLVVFPNPSEGEINVLSYEENIQKITISDITGKTIKVYSFSENTKNEIINLTELSNSIYYLRIETGANQFTQKIIISGNKK